MKALKAITGLGLILLIIFALMGTSMTGFIIASMGATGMGDVVSEIQRMKTEVEKVCLQPWGISQIQVPVEGGAKNETKTILVGPSATYIDAPEYPYSSTA